VDPVWDGVLRALLPRIGIMRLSSFFAVPRSWVCFTYRLHSGVRTHPWLSVGHPFHSRWKVTPDWASPSGRGRRYPQAWWTRGATRAPSTPSVVTSVDLVSSSANASSSGWIDSTRSARSCPAAGPDRPPRRARDAADRSPTNTPAWSAAPADARDRPRVRSIPRSGRWIPRNARSACATPAPQAVPCTARRPAAPCAGRGGGRSPRRPGSPPAVAVTRPPPARWAARPGPWAVDCSAEGARSASTLVSTR
jgi:hypothetical protein